MYWLWMSLQITWISNLKNVLKAALQNMKEPCFWYLTTGIFFKVCLISFMSSEIKIKEYLGDVNYLEQRNLENMREVEKKDALKAAQRIVIKLPMKNKKGERALQNRLQSGKSNQAIRKGHSA
jgi:ATP-binding cassette subfamily F protein 3